MNFEKIIEIYQLYIHIFRQLIFPRICEDSLENCYADAECAFDTAEFNESWQFQCSSTSKPHLFEAEVVKRTRNSKPRIASSLTTFPRPSPGQTQTNTNTPKCRRTNSIFSFIVLLIPETYSDSRLPRLATASRSTQQKISRPIHQQMRILLPNV